MRKTINILLLILILINFIYVLSGVLNFPLISIDVYSIWLYKAKGFYFNEGDIWGFLRGLTYSHPQYPILLPYLFFLVFKFFGNFNEIYVLLIYPLLYLLILYLSYRTLRVIKIEKTYAMLFTYIYSMFSPLLAMAGREHAGEADIFIVLSYWLILLLSFEFLKNKKLQNLYWMSFIIILASNIKMEGAFLAVIYIFLPIKTRVKVFFTLISVLPVLIWMIFRTWINIPADFGYIFPGIMEIIERSYRIIFLILKEMIKINNWYIFWPMFVFSFFASSFKKGKTQKFPAKTLGLISILFFINYLFSSLSPEFYVQSSIDRILTQLSPFYYIYFAINVYKLSS